MHHYTLDKLSTLPPKESDKEALMAITIEQVEKISKLQVRLYAERKQAVLIVLQGMDASGKDGVIKKVLNGINPQGCRVYSFKKPTEEEMGHDFLWRIHKVVPEKGMIHIFNRSHYEDVLIQRVHKWIDEKTVKERFDHINNFEYLLESTGTKVLKFYLHISAEEQLVRLEERKTNPEKMWKWNPADMTEREHLKAYFAAYEDVFRKCKQASPWHLIPADKNWYKEYLVSKVILEKLQEMNPAFPPLSTE